MGKDLLTVLVASFAELEQNACHLALALLCVCVCVILSTMLKNRLAIIIKKIHLQKNHKNGINVSVSETSNNMCTACSVICLYQINFICKSHLRFYELVLN